MNQNSGASKEKAVITIGETVTGQTQRKESPVTIVLLSFIVLFLIVLFAFGFQRINSYQNDISNLHSTSIPTPNSR